VGHEQLLRADVQAVLHQPVGVVAPAAGFPHQGDLGAALHGAQIVDQGQRGRDGPPEHLAERRSTVPPACSITDCP